MLSKQVCYGKAPEDEDFRGGYNGAPRCLPRSWSAKNHPTRSRKIIYQKCKGAVVVYIL